MATNFGRTMSAYVPSLAEIQADLVRYAGNLGGLAQSGKKALQTSLSNNLPLMQIPALNNSPALVPTDAEPYPWGVTWPGKTARDNRFVNTDEVVNSFKTWKDFSLMFPEICLTLERNAAKEGQLMPVEKLTVEGKLHQAVFAALHAKSSS